MCHRTIKIQNFSLIKNVNKQHSTKITNSKEHNFSLLTFSRYLAKLFSYCYNYKKMDFSQDFQYVRERSKNKF